MKKAIIAFSCLTIMFVSCKKEDTTPKAVTPTKENLTGTWMVTAASLSSGGTTVNIFDNSDASMNFYDACDRDDKYLLKSDLSFEIEDAGTQCDPNNNYTGGTWGLTNATSINIDGEEWAIKSFDGKYLVVTATSGSITQSSTYSKQ